MFRFATLVMLSGDVSCIVGYGNARKGMVVYFSSKLIQKYFTIIILLLQLVSNLTNYGSHTGTVSANVSPQSQTVNESQVFVFPCSSSTVSSSPTWIINGVHYFPSELPSNYCVNQTGLIVLATADLNQSTYQCAFVSATFSGGFLDIDNQISLPPAVLTVIKSGK